MAGWLIRDVAKGRGTSAGSMAKSIGRDLFDPGNLFGMFGDAAKSTKPKKAYTARYVSDQGYQGAQQEAAQLEQALAANLDAQGRRRQAPGLKDQQRQIEARLNKMKGIIAAGETTRLEGKAGRAATMAEEIAAARGIEGRLEPLRQQRLDLANALQAQARGEVPGAGQAFYQAQQDQNLANALAMARSQPGLSPGLAARGAMSSAAATNLQAQQQAAIIAAQEQRQAQEQLSGLLSSQQGIDLQTAQLRGQLVAQYTQMGYTEDQAEMLAALEATRLHQQGSQFNVGTQFQAAESAAGRQAGFLGGGLQIGGDLFASGLGSSGGGGRQQQPQQAPAA